MVSRAAMHAACELEELDMAQMNEPQEWTPAYKACVCEVIQRAIDFDAVVAHARANTERQRRERKTQWETHHTVPETVDKITEYGLTQRLSRPVRVF